MADLLRSGNTMLNMACPVCNNPIFRNKDGNIFCPTCNRNVLIVNNDSQQNVNIKKDMIYNKEQENSHYITHNVLLNSLQNTLFEKIEILTQKLKEETQLQVIESYTKILLNCLEIINKIRTNKEF
ncbi:MAG: Sjogren's syndrome/scleroderma autoantigen 1 family protein [Promethearchaeota archaeon]